jgi:superfamily II DNA/RNA helicase
VLEVTSPDEKKDLVEALASGTGRRILFTRTKHQAKKLAKQLTASGIPSVDLHGNLAQSARDRNLAAFGEGSVKVLVATDVAARGVHVDNVELVVHVDPPAEHKAYLHRSGRTARAGSAGDVVTVMLSAQAEDVRTLLRKAAISAAPQRVTAGSPAVAELVGAVAPRVAPAPVQHEQRSAGAGTSQGANAQRKRARRNGRPQAASSVGGGQGAGRGQSAERGQGAGRGQSAERGQSTRGAQSAGRTQTAERPQGAGRSQSAGRGQSSRRAHEAPSHTRTTDAGVRRGHGSRRAQG